MILGSIFFAICAISALSGALVTVLTRNPIRGALGLLLTIIGIAGLYIKLHAQFLAAIQLIVYAGAVVVLFVFVLMLLGADATDPPSARRSIVSRGAGGLGLVASFALATYHVLRVYAPKAAGRYGGLPTDFGSVAAVGRRLFADALIPFELATALLIVAVLGAIVVARTGSQKPGSTAPKTLGAHRFFSGPIRARVASDPVIKDSP